MYAKQLSGIHTIGGISSKVELNCTFFWLAELTSKPNSLILTPSRQVGNSPVPEPATAPIPTPVRTSAVAPKTETQSSQDVATAETKVDTDKSTTVVAPKTPAAPKEGTQAELQLAKGPEPEQAHQDVDPADKDATTRKAWDVEPCHATPCCC